MTYPQQQYDKKILIGGGEEGKERKRQQKNPSTDVYKLKLFKVNPGMMKIYL
jgi:hypothetical protein